MESSDNASPSSLADVQSRRDPRQVTIDKVGVTNIRYPIVVLDRAHERQHTIATVNMYVDLPHHFKGTHLSRFLEVLNEYEEITVYNIPTMLQHLRDRLNAENAHLEIEFPYFLQKAAPVTQVLGMMEYTCGYRAMVDGVKDFVLSLKVPVATVCPCSKEISARGAHNQRGLVILEVRTKALVWFEELIDTVERSASSALYPILKRPDEKWVTEHGYDHPQFVEDVLREIAVALRRDERITWYRVSVETYESLHTYNAYACIEQWKAAETKSGQS